MKVFAGRYGKLGMFGWVQDCIDMYLPMELMFICDWSSFSFIKYEPCKIVGFFTY